MSSDINKITVKHRGEKFKIRFERQNNDTLLVGLKGETIPVQLDDLVTGQDLGKSSEIEDDLFIAEESNEVRAPIPGVVAKVLVKKDQEVQKGQVVLCLLAMKMENEICTSTAGIVEKLHVREGQAVQSEDLLVTLRTED